MPYKYKVRIKAYGAKGANGSTSNATKGPGGNGAAITAEYEVLPGEGGIDTDGVGNSIWRLTYKKISGGAGGTVRNTNKNGGRGGDGVEVRTASNIIVIAGGGGGGAGDDIQTGYGGGNANGTGTTDGNYSKVAGGDGSGQTTQNTGKGGNNGTGGTGGFGGGGQNYISGSDGENYDSGGKGGAGASSTEDRAGGGGGGGGYGGGGGGVAGFGIASGGGAGASRIWNNESDLSVGFKYITTNTSLVANTSTNVYLEFIPYVSTDNGVTWITQYQYPAKVLTQSEMTYAYQTIDIRLNTLPRVDLAGITDYTPLSVSILSDQTVNWVFGVVEYDFDEEYYIKNNGTYTLVRRFSRNGGVVVEPNEVVVDIHSSDGIKRGTVRNTEQGFLSFTGSGTDNDGVQSTFEVWLKDPDSVTPYGNLGTTFTVTQYKRLYKPTSKTFTASTEPPTGLITSNGVDIATLFQPKSFLNFTPTGTYTGKFFNSDIDYSTIFGEYSSTFSGDSKISTNTGFQINGTDIRHIYAAKKTSLDIFDTTPGTRNYRFSLPQATEALLICVGGGGAGNHGSQGGQGGHGGKIIIQDITLLSGNHIIQMRIGAGEDKNSSAPVTRRGGDSFIILNGPSTITYNTVNIPAQNFGTVTSLVNENDGGDRSYIPNRADDVKSFIDNPAENARDGGFQLDYEGTIYNIGGGGGAGSEDTQSGLIITNVLESGKGYYGGQNGYTRNTPTSRNSNYGGGGGGGFKRNNTNIRTDGGSGGHGLCAILFKQ